MIEFDHRGQVFQARHLVRLGHGGEVIAQAGVGGGAVGRGQPVVGVAPHDGVQVEPVLLRVVVQQPARNQVPQVGVELLAADATGVAAPRLLSNAFCVSVAPFPPAP